MAIIKLSPYILDSSLDFSFRNVTSTGNLITLNANLGNAAIANYITGTLTTAAQPNITSVGSLTSVNVTGDATVGGNLSVTGNLTVSGTVTSVNSSTVNINDINIVLANNATTAAQANGGGITINGANATMIYNSSSNAFVFSHPISANGSLLTSITGANVTGTVSYASTANSVAVANVVGIGNIATINRDGNASNILYGNGIFAAAPSSGTTYGDSNVASYLPTYTGNISAGNIIVSGNITDNNGDLNITTTSGGNINLIATSTGRVIIDGMIWPGSDGLANYILQTDGSNNLSWVQQTGNATAVALNTAYVSRTYTGDGTTVNFGVSTNLTSTSVIVSLSGVVQTPTVDYNVSGTTLTFTTAPPNGVGINIREIGIPLAGGSNGQVLYNNSGTIGGTASFTYDAGTGTITANSLVVNSANFGSVANLRITGGNVGDILSSLGNGRMAWANVAANGNVIVQGSVGGSASVTVASTAPASPAQGDLWLDSESGELNVYFGGAWGSVADSAPQFLSVVNSFTGDSVTTSYTLTTTPSSKEYTLVAIGGILQPKSTYTVTGNVLQFTSAIPTNTPIEVTILGGLAAPIGTASTVTASSQPSITSVGTLTSLAVAGDVSVTSGNITISGQKVSTQGKAFALSLVFGF